MLTPPPRSIQEKERSGVFAQAQVHRVISSRRITRILKRRDRIVKHLEQLARDKGEPAVFEF
jgi:hypothetical protein